MNSTPYIPRGKVTESTVIICYKHKQDLVDWSESVIGKATSYQLTPGEPYKPSWVEYSGEVGQVYYSHRDMFSYCNLTLWRGVHAARGIRANRFYLVGDISITAEQSNYLNTRLGRGD